MRSPVFILVSVLAVCASVSVPAAADTLLAGYEPSETNLTVTSPDASVTTLASVQGGIGGVPTATEGIYVLQLTWAGETDRKVEIRHNWTGFTFDLLGEDRILVDVYMTSQLSPDLNGIWDDVFSWHQALSVPPNPNEWYTLEFDVSGCNNTSLDHISALIFEGMEVNDGTIYFDNLRLVCSSPTGVIAAGHDSRIDLRWQPVSVPSLQGYNVYRAASEAGPFTKLNSAVHTVSVYSDFFGTNDQTYYYYVTAVDGGSVESDASDIVSSTSYAMTDDQLLTSVQEATFRYFWDFGHPVSGMARERYALYDRQTVTTGGSGMGLITIIVGVERGFITRAQAAERILNILTFLQDTAPRYHGAWSHWMDGTTGVTIPVDYDGGGNPIVSADIVETSYLIQGMFTVRQYFDSTDAVETEIRSRATQLYEEVDWDWYRRPGETDGTHLYWLWSPTHGWEGSFPFGGAEVMITYLLAIASPTHPIPASCYYDGFGGGGSYENGNRYYGFTQWASAYETPMFWTHYSYLGFDPRDKSDNYCNYFNNSRNISLIDREYCIDNPKGFTGYSDLVWGLTASYCPWGYVVHAPGGTDNGTITPTAAISSIPYTPAESLDTLKHFYHTYGNDLWGPFGFYDAFNLQENWYSDGYLAIDQGTIVPMIENYRTQFCWDLFMANPEIQPMLDSIGWATGSGAGLKVKYYEGSWSSLPDFAALTPVFEEVASIPKENIGNRDDYYGLRFSGYISIDQPGTYTFYTNSDDGSKLYIDSVLVVDNDGLHGFQERSGTISLTAGMHTITVDFFEADGNVLLEASYAGPGIIKQKIPVNVLFQCNLAGDSNNDCHVDITDLRIMAADWLNDYTFVDFAEIAGSWLE